MASLLPQNVKEEFAENIRKSKGARSKVEGARRLVSSRLIFKFGAKWWNLHREEIVDLLDEIEKAPHTEREEGK